MSCGRRGRQDRVTALCAEAAGVGILFVCEKYNTLHFPATDEQQRHRAAQKRAARCHQGAAVLRPGGKPDRVSDSEPGPAIGRGRRASDSERGGRALFSSRRRRALASRLRLPSERGERQRAERAIARASVASACLHHRRAQARLLPV